MADSKIAQTNQQVRFRGRGENMADETNDRADDLHRKGVISEGARDKLKAKNKPKEKAKSADKVDSDIEGGDEKDPGFKGNTKPKPVMPGKGRDDVVIPKKKLSLDEENDDGDHEYR